ncbi:Repressible high-affinity phosphate, partial [Hortaea werneckii]
MMGAVFAMQGLGQFGAGIISLIVVSGFKQSLLTAETVGQCGGVCGEAVDKSWRVIIGFGAVPGCIALYYRLTIPETPRYTFDVSRDIVKAGSDVKTYLNSAPEGLPDEIARVRTMREEAPQLEIPKASLSNFFAHYSQWKYGKVLLGTAGSWFFLDVAFYGVGLNNSTILQAIGYGKGDTVYEILYNIS